MLEVNSIDDYNCINRLEGCLGKHRLRTLYEIKLSSNCRSLTVQFKGRRDVFGDALEPSQTIKVQPCESLYFQLKTNTMTAKQYKYKDKEYDFQFTVSNTALLEHPIDWDKAHAMHEYLVRSMILGICWRVRCESTLKTKQ